MQDWEGWSREELIQEMKGLRQEMFERSGSEEAAGDRFRVFFQESLVPFWLEDWSFVAEYVRGLFDSGVEDLQRYFAQNPQSLVSCMDMVRLVDANRATLEFFGFNHKTQMLSERDCRMTPWARRTFLQALSSFLRGGKGSFRSETSMLDAAGELRRLIIYLNVPGSHRQDLDQVHITATDVTEMRDVQARLEKRRQFDRLIGNLAGSFVFPEDLERTIEDSLSALGRLSEASRAYLIRFDEGYRRIIGYHEWCAEGVSSSRQHVIQTLLENRPWYFQRLLQNREVLIDNVALLPAEAGAEKATFEAQGVRSLVAIPVFVGGRLEGAVGFDDVENTEKWGDIALEQLRLFCGILGNALHGLRKADQVRIQKRKLDAVFRAAEDVGFVTTDVSGADFRVSGFSPGAERIFGYSEEEALGRPVSLLHDPADIDRFPEIKRELDEGQGNVKWDTTLLRKGGKPFPALLSLSPLREEGGAFTEVLGVVLDLSSIRTAQEALRESRERLRLALDATRDGVWDWHVDRDRVFLSSGWFKMVGKREEKEGLPFSQWMEFIHEEDRSEVMAKLEAHLSGETPLFEVTARIRTAGRTWLWGLERGQVVRRNDAGKPLRVVGTQVDITELKAAKDELEAVNEKITVSLARMVELRDVYTAGHQVRTSRLVTAIAREMGLPEEQVSVMRTAALLHDIGKMAIPTEILNKPGELSELEWNLIRIHPEEGASLLADVPFPPEVAEIVRQHHERWNGSGYPRGLKKKGILLGSRILAVADVVETMSSHRPYRPQKGLEEALREVETGKGRIYDPEVADACLRLFREQGFSLKEAAESPSGR